MMSTAPATVALAAVQAPTASTSKAAVAGGLGGAGVAIYLVDRLLANDGQLAANMLTKLSPLLGPVWASYPVILILIGIAGWFGIKWGKAQTARAAADAAAAAAAADLSGKVGAVASGLDGLRVEVHELRGALQDHADQVDVRLRDYDEGLRAVQADVSILARRVDVIERPASRRSAKTPAKTPAKRPATVA